MTGSSSCPPTRRSAPTYADWAGLDDPVIDVAVTPNRQDAMGVHGIARDLAAAGLGTLKPVDVPADRRRLPLPDRDPHRRSGGLPGLLRPGDPRRAQRRLAGLAAAAAEGGRAAADQRAGRHDQLHHARATAGRCTSTTSPSSRARSSPAGRATARQVLALNGKTYTLDPSMTVIADDARRPRYRRHHGRRAFAASPRRPPTS